MVKDIVASRPDDTVRVATPEDPVEYARYVMSHLERRKNTFGVGLSSDVIWTILLQLYMDHHDGNNRSVSSLVRITGFPKSSVLRWLDTLTDREIIARTRDTNDTRRSWVVLSSRSIERITSVLSVCAEIKLSDISVLA